MIFRIAKVFALALSFLISPLPRPALAGDSWNLIVGGVEDQSRQTSAALFRSASRIFEGFALLELKSFSASRDQFGSAIQLLNGASRSLVEIANRPEVRKPVRMDRLQPQEAGNLASWYREKSGILQFGTEDLAKLTASDLLHVAAKEADRIAKLIETEFRDVSANNPDRARRLINEIARFLIVGTIATKAFPT